MYVKEMESVDWINVAQDWNQWWTLVNTKYFCGVWSIHNNSKIGNFEISISTD
jgi:hypothetical protein